MQTLVAPPEAPTHSESTTPPPPPRLRRRHWAGLVRLLGAVILVVALAAAIVGMLAIGVLTIGAVAGNPGPVAMSRNWAGYAATGGSYTAVSGTWTVPDFSASSPTGLDATWVGIGGIDSRDLIQAGTQQQTSGAGHTQYSAWVETLPQPSRTVPLVIHAGDSISVSLSEQSRGNWLVLLTNNPNGPAHKRVSLPQPSGIGCPAETTVNPVEDSRPACGMPMARVINSDTQDCPNGLSASSS
jgi:Peptidase A4 family